MRDVCHINHLPPLSPPCDPAFAKVTADNSSGASAADISEPDAYVTNSYIWADGAVQNNVVYVNRNGQSSAAYQYEAGGALRFVDQTEVTVPRAIIPKERELITTARTRTRHSMSPFCYS